MQFLGLFLFRKFLICTKGGKFTTYSKSVVRNDLSDRRVNMPSEKTTCNYSLYICKGNQNLINISNVGFGAFCNIRCEDTTHYVQSFNVEQKAVTEHSF